jgi:hypothetical protein
MAKNKSSKGGSKAKKVQKVGRDSSKDAMTFVVLAFGIAVGIALASQRGEAPLAEGPPLKEPMKIPPWPAALVRSNKTASGCPDKFEDIDGRDRDAVFHNIHKQWPPLRQYPGNTPSQATEAWNEYHLHKERRLMAITDDGWRWERWLEQVQIRNLRNWTASGWDLTDMPAATHEKALKFYQENKHKAFDEGKIAGYIAGQRSMLPMPRGLKDEVTAEAQKLVAKWAGYEKASDIEATSTYGIRTYHDGSVLETHVDRVESHILSVVYCIDRKHNKPWLMETDPDLLGNNAKVDVLPGKLFFYESAKVHALLLFCLNSVFIVLMETN